MTSAENGHFARNTDAHMHSGATSESSSSTEMGMQEDQSPVLPPTKLKQMRTVSGQDWCDDDDDEEDDEELEEGDGTDEKGGPHATLSSHGPAVSEGSVDHPNECMPCTFYCFTKRGCNRGRDCRFCHLTHQSKLQQRREAWKKQQREKRKSIRERARKEASVQKGAVPVKDSSPNPPANQAFSRRAEQTRSPINNIADGPDNTRMPSTRTPMMTNKEREPTLTYRPTSNVLLVVGQEVYLEPSLDCVALSYRLKVPLPHGLALDQATGIIHGSPTVAAAKRTILVEADVLHIGTIRGSIEFEVVDLLSKDLAIGHLSEIEPGKFVVLVHQPENPPSDMGGKYDYSRQQRGMRGNTTRGMKTKAMQGMMMQNSEESNFMMMRQGAHMPNAPVLMQPCL